MAQSNPQSARSPFVRHARNGTPISDVMTQMKCNRRSAQKRLCEGRALLEGLSENEEMVSENINQAVTLLRHSGGAKPVINRWRWPDVALGFQRAA